MFYVYMFKDLEIGKFWDVETTYLFIRFQIIDFHPKFKKRQPILKNNKNCILCKVNIFFSEHSRRLCITVVHLMNSHQEMSSR